MDGGTVTAVVHRASLITASTSRWASTSAESFATRLTDQPTASCGMLNPKWRSSTATPLALGKPPMKTTSASRVSAARASAIQSAWDSPPTLLQTTPATRSSGSKSLYPSSIAAADRASAQACVCHVGDPY